MPSLKKPSTGMLLTTKRLSETRSESRQRRLPTVARPDPYDIPEMPGDAVLRLRRPDDEVARLSPLRQQKKESIASSKRANSSPAKEDTPGSKTPAHQQSSPEQEPEIVKSPTDSRRASGEQGTSRRGSGEESVGSAERHASPAVILPDSRTSAQSRDSSAVSEPSDKMNGALGLEDDTIAVMEHLQRSALSEKSPEADRSESPAKRRKLSGMRDPEAPDDDSLSAKPTEQLPAAPKSANGNSSRPKFKLKRGKSRFDVVRRSKQPVKVNKVRPSEVFPGQSSTGQGDEETSENVMTDVPAEISRQRKKPPKVAQKKKATIVAPFVEIEEETQLKAAPATSRHDSEPDEGDRDSEPRSGHLLGEYRMMKKFLRCTEAVRAIAENEDVDRDIAKMKKFCERFVMQLNKLQSRPADTLLLDDPPEELETIKSDIHMLCGRNPSRPINRHSQQQGQSIYYCMIPALVQVLVAMVECYRVTDEHDADKELSVTIHHLGTISDLLRLIVDLGEGAKLYARPDTSLAMVKPIQNKVLAPMKKIESTFRRHIRHHAEMQAQRALNREEAARREAAERAEEEAQQEKARWDKVSQKWTQLHEERYAADEIIKPLAKRRHLRQPSPEPEEDHNGQRFTRVEVFRPRIGPPHALVEEVKSQAWPQPAYQALMTGLREWAGDVMVFERIFRRYCRRNGPLNAYNGTEIVVMAALMRHDFEQAVEENEEADKAELQWMKCIPDWTRLHTVLEQLEAGMAVV